MKRAFIAIALNPSLLTSGQKGNRREAEEWAEHLMFTNPKHMQVFITETVAVVERESPPVKVTELPPLDEPDQPSLNIVRHAN